MSKYYAVVTGASSGIGREIGEILASRGLNLILAGRREERLKVLAKDWSRRYQVKILYQGIDLSIPENCEAFYEFCEPYPVAVLVNSAGYGKAGFARELPLREELGMVDTNIVALQMLTRLFLRRMKRGYILNVASMAAFQPCPYMAAYGATKAYVLQYSLSLNYELKRQGSDVSVSVLCPGPVETEFNRVAGVVGFAMPGQSPEECAWEAVQGMFRRKSMIIPGRSNRLIRMAGKLLPVAWILPLEYWIQTSKKKA